MTSGYHGSGSGNGAGMPSSSGGIQPLLGGTTGLPDQIGQRRMDLLMMGKRTFGDYQHQQQQFQQQQQQQQTYSYLQKLQLNQQQQQQHQHQQQMLSSSTSMMLSQNPYLLRSIKQQRTIDLSSPSFNNNIINTNINNNININNIVSNNNNNNNNNNFSSTQLGVPVYQQQARQQQHIPLLNTYQFTNTNPTQLNSTINPFISNTNQLINLGSGQRHGQGQVCEIGYSNSGPNLVTPKLEPEEQKILNTLQELEKHLLDDDDDDDDVTRQRENDAVSGVTNSDWSDTFQDLIGPGSGLGPNPSPSPDQDQGTSSTICSNSTTTTATATASNGNNNVISPSPTSSTSSCCTTATVAASAKQLIAEAATAISDGRNDVVTEILSKLDQISDCKGNSEQRLGYYMSNALRSRALPTEHAPPVAALYGAEQAAAMYTLYDVLPCFKFGLLAANFVMLEAITKATQEGLKIHVIDFDVGNGAQYVHLLRALGERKAHAPSVVLKITVVETEVVGDKGGAHESVRDELVGLAKRVGINFEYSCVARAIHELSRESLGCEEREAVVVNFAFKVYKVPDESVSMENLRDELLRRVKGLSPRAVTLVEQDMNGNTAPFMTRVNEACGYYGALFDSLEATLPRENVDRCRVEEGLGRKMANLIACEGRDRVERAEVFGKWRARMGMAGFELKAISQTVVESMRAKLNSTRGGNPGFTVKEENGGVGFGWMGRSLTAASAWR